MSLTDFITKTGSVPKGKRSEDNGADIQKKQTAERLYPKGNLSGVRIVPTGGELISAYSLQSQQKRTVHCLCLTIAESGFALTGKGR